MSGNPESHDMAGKTRYHPGLERLGQRKRVESICSSGVVEDIKQVRYRQSI